MGPIYEFLLSGGLEQGPLKAGRVRKLVLPPLGRVGVGVWGRERPLHSLSISRRSAIAAYFVPGFP